MDFGCEKGPRNSKKHLSENWKDSVEIARNRFLVGFENNIDIPGISSSFLEILKYLEFPKKKTSVCLSAKVCDSCLSNPPVNFSNISTWQSQMI